MKAANTMFRVWASKSRVANHAFYEKQYGTLVPFLWFFSTIFKITKMSDFTEHQLIMFGRVLSGFLQHQKPVFTLARMIRRLFLHHSIEEA